MIAEEYVGVAAGLVALGVVWAIHDIPGDECEFTGRLDTLGAFREGVVTDDVVLGVKHVEDSAHLHPQLPSLGKLGRDCKG